MTSIEDFRRMVDGKTVDNIEPYLSLLFYRVVKKALVKHSERASSQEVSVICVTILL